MVSDDFSHTVVRRDDSRGQVTHLSAEGAGYGSTAQVRKPMAAVSATMVGAPASGARSETR